MTLIVFLKNLISQVDEVLVLDSIDVNEENRQTYKVILKLIINLFSIKSINFCFPQTLLSLRVKQYVPANQQ